MVYEAIKRTTEAKNDDDNKKSLTLTEKSEILVYHEAIGMTNTSDIQKEDTTCKFTKLYDKQSSGNEKKILRRNVHHIKTTTA